MEDSQFCLLEWKKSVAHVRVPRGMTSFFRVSLVSSAKAMKTAIAAVIRPNQPPACRSKLCKDMGLGRVSTNPSSLKRKIRKQMQVDKCGAEN